MCSGGPKPGGSSASNSEKIPPVSSAVALTVMANEPRSIALPRRAHARTRRSHSSSDLSFQGLSQAVDQDCGVLVAEDERRPDLEDVLAQPGSADQDAELAQPVDDARDQLGP